MATLGSITSNTDMGIVGPTGYTGYTGPAGEDGTIGVNGATGPTGYTGPAGNNGSAGATGYTGYSGYTGPGNFTGYTGPTGFTGATGFSGYTGFTGYTGAGNFTGYTGYSGYTGATGYTGPAGAGGTSGASLGQVFLSVTMTNIGNSYKDIYASAFDIENLMKIDFTGITSVRAVFLWDYVGAGTQQVRWADATDNNNVLLESATFTADQDPGDTGWVSLPATFVNATKQIEWQGKSTTAGDDPVAKGYILFAK